MRASRTGEVSSLVRGPWAQETGLKAHPRSDTGVKDSQAFLVSKSHCESNTRKGISMSQLGALAHLVAIGPGAAMQWLLHHPQTPVCFVSFSAENWPCNNTHGTVFHQLLTEGGNNAVSFEQIWFLLGIFILLTCSMLEIFRRKDNREY